MCSSCKKMGQWDTLQSFLTTNKGTKKWKSRDNDFPELEHLKTTLEDISNTTIHFNTLAEIERRDVLKKFELPVSIKHTF